MQNWRDIRNIILDRIHNRHWLPGELIPNEADLAQEFKVARTTVNRALRSIAEDGLLDRKRRAGTRVALHPVRKAVLKIPVLRQEIQAQNKTYSYVLISSRITEPPPAIRAQLACAPGVQALQLCALHLGNSTPFVHEDRWINLELLPAARQADFTTHNANEWLLTHAPFTCGEFAFAAKNAEPDLAQILKIEPNAPVLTVDRRTWHDQATITVVRLTYTPGHQLHLTV